MRDDTRSALLHSFRPQLLPLTHNLTAAVFPLMKIFPAAFCISHAEQEGLISQDSVIVETSSGTMALGLALICNWSGYRLIIVTDHACDDALRRRMQDLGAQIEIVSSPASTGGFQRARLDRVRDICRCGNNYWWVNQYDNLANAAAYGTLAAQLVGEVGRVDCLIGCVGSGGSMCGTSSYLRVLFPDLYVVGVDTFGSVLFGQPDSPRQLRGLGNSLLPENLDHTCFNEVHWVSVEEAYTATRILHQTTGLFRGGTSGACWMVARHWAEQNPEKRVICLFADDGQRYVNTVYNDEAMHANKYWLPELPNKPREVTDPTEAGPTWSCMQWARRNYLSVVSRPCLITATI
jgi:S-sulfo-L-cysteine synthase (3-phospho-L-serine-dependent)